MKKILVVGSRGFIGQNVKRHFEEKGDEVYSVTTSQDENQKSFQVEKLDPDYLSIFKKHEFDIVINASGSKGVGFSWENTFEDHLMNVTVNSRLLQAIVDTNQNPKFLHFSSAAVYGNPKSLPIKEDFKTEPISPYGFHKLQAETLLKEYHDLYDLQTVNLRVFSAYGPGLRKQLLWDVFQKIVKAGDGPITLYGTGNESRDFIYIEDILQAIDLILEKASFQGEVFNIANEKEVQISEIVSRFLEALNKDNEIIFGGEEKKGDPINWKADISKLKDLGYQQKNELKEGLIKYSKWIENA